MFTIDKSQGIDKKVIILIVQEGNDQLVEQPRRLNVALTRAKTKLVVIGSLTYFEKIRVGSRNLGMLLKAYRREITAKMISDVIRHFEE